MITPPEENGRFPRHRKRPNRRRQRRKKELRQSQTVVIGLGGSAEAVETILQMQPDLKGHILRLDTDISVYEDSVSADPCHLENGGDMEAIIENKHRFPYIADGAVPAFTTGFETTWGAGRIRMATTILLGFNLPAVKARIRTLLEHVLKKLQGRHPKTLVVHLVFSVLGGTGSALAVPVAALVLDAAHNLAPALNVEIRAQVFLPALFNGMALTPDEQQRNLANAEITRRELYLAQQPDSIRDLAAYLDIKRPPKRPLFNEIHCYDCSNSGAGVDQLHQVFEKAATNIALSHYRSLLAVDLSRSLNPQTAQNGASGQKFGTSVIACSQTSVAKVPVDKLATVYVARTLQAMLETAVRPATVQQTLSVKERFFAGLEVDASLRSAQAKLRPDRTYLVPSTHAKLGNQELLAAIARANDRWSRLGGQDMRHKASRLVRELRADASQRAGDFVAAIGEHVSSIPHFSGVLRQSLDVLANRLSQIQREVQRLAQIDHAAVHQRAVSKLQAASGLWGKRKLRRAAIQSFNAMIEAECTETALRAYCTDCLMPMIDSLTKEVQRLEAIEHDMSTASQQIELDLPGIEATVGFRNNCYTEVFGRDELPQVLDRLQRDVGENIEMDNERDIKRLVQSRCHGELGAVLDEAATRIGLSVREFLERLTGDIRSFVDHFRLDFDLDAWLADRLERFSLPAKLNLAVVPSGCCPVRTYLIGPASEEGPLTDVACQTAQEMQFEYREGDDPFQLVFYAKISRAPFTSMPGLDEQQAGYERFRATAPIGHIWGILESHGALAGAHEELQDRPALAAPHSNDQPEAVATNRLVFQAAANRSGDGENS